MRVPLFVIGLVSTLFAPAWFTILCMLMLALFFPAWEILILGLLMDLVWLPHSAYPLPLFSLAAVFLLWVLEPLRLQFLR